MIALAALGISVIGGIGGVAHGAFHRNSPLFGPALGKIDSDRKVVALTFDDGPNPDATPLILDTLAEKGVHATFFVLGSHAERWPELVRRISSEGHQLGNHGYFHRKLQFKSPFYVSRDIRLGIRAIKRAGGEEIEQEAVDLGRVLVGRPVAGLRDAMQVEAGDPVAGAEPQARRQDACVAGAVDRRRVLVDILSARAGCPDETLPDLTLVENDRVGDLNHETRISRF